jgi:hypothetical protein
MRFKRAVKKNRKFNAAQKEGLLKIIDGISQACLTTITLAGVLTTTMLAGGQDS